LFGINPKDLKKAMKRMGMEIEEIKALSLSIDMEDGYRLIIDSPQVMQIKAKGQPTMFYVIGEPRKVEPTNESIELSEDDIRLVMEQAGVSEDDARRALVESRGDIAEAILKLKGK